MIAPSIRDQLRGTATLLRYIGRASKAVGFYGVDAASAGEVDEWVDYAPTLAIGAEFERTCAYIDSYLELRTFLAGYQLTIADIAVWAQLQGGLYFSLALQGEFCYEFKVQI